MLALQKYGFYHFKFQENPFGEKMENAFRKSRNLLTSSVNTFVLSKMLSIAWENINVSLS